MRGLQPRRLLSLPSLSHGSSALFCVALCRYPITNLFDVFLSRYRIIVGSATEARLPVSRAAASAAATDTLREACASLASMMSDDVPESDLQVGRTLVFMKRHACTLPYSTRCCCPLA